MMKYRLIKFSGDRENDSKSTAILYWVSNKSIEDAHEEVIETILSMNITGIIDRVPEYDTKLKRWTITFETIASDVVVTIDKVQNKIVLLTDSEGVDTLFTFVDYLLNCDYEKDITYRAKRVFDCVRETVRRRIKKG